MKIKILDLENNYFKHFHRKLDNKYQKDIVL